ncbi:hypothetical protein BDV93DRAFT_549938 [Ceratobasidium sp. AG-I]|nr:hypothetical protein BDV93DRAFT_549938 [Ceratobasidium sp. AG-I]
MPRRQFRLVASDDYKPRSNLDIPSVGHLLKSLKSGHKNVRSSQNQLFAEMHILERVYYKGKNQHGLALFWRSVVSVRRMASRIHETNIPGLLEVLASLFHEESFGAPKVFSGAWTRIPSFENVGKILQRLLDISLLLRTANEAFQKAYRAFCLFMSNTAFLQLTIVLVSVDARMTSLASSLLQSLSSIIPRVYAVFEALEPPALLKRRLSMRLKELSSASAQPPLELPVPASSPKDSDTIPLYTGDEDIGSAIPRTALPTQPTHILPDEPALSPSPRAISPSPSTTDVILETDMVPSPPPSALLTLPSQPPPTSNFPTEPEPAARTAPSTSAKARTRIVPRDKTDNARAVVATSTKPKKRRKVRDEIDDIFG